MTGDDWVERGKKWKKKEKIKSNLTLLSAPVKQPSAAETNVLVHMKESVLTTPSVEQV